MGDSDQTKLNFIIPLRFVVSAGVSNIYPQLYDKAHPEYLHQPKKGPIWERIAREAEFGMRKARRPDGIQFAPVFWPTTSVFQRVAMEKPHRPTFMAKNSHFCEHAAQQEKDFDQFYDYPIGDTEELQTAPPAKRKPTTPRFQVNSDINALDAKFLSVLEQQDDQWTQFGKFVGASLSQKSDKKKQRELCMKIHQLLNEYDSD
ncbi:hypothetical protein DdX_15584 [Ditylenchus destructor]|uniref:MADF domain-containing protein n=1 Tax=Ditylenchus destructor TaxID=166010 RepID=A0AAD4MP81_9BILA|nr:hypothetical protein DdX_15584 [Ditylenchus destructor]